MKGTFPSRLWLLGYPLALLNIFSYSGSVITLAFVGRLGSYELSVAVLATSVYNVTGYSIMYGMAGAIETLGGQVGSPSPVAISAVAGKASWLRAAGSLSSWGVAIATVPVQCVQQQRTWSGLASLAGVHQSADFCVVTPLHQAYGACQYVLVGITLQRGLLISAAQFAVVMSFWTQLERFLLLVGKHNS